MTLISRQSTKPLCPDTSPSIGNTKEADRRGKYVEEKQRRREWLRTVLFHDGSFEIFQ